MEYDGLGRRIVKAVDNSGDWDCTYKYYYNGQQMVEVQNGSDYALKQYVWGLQYVDELVQIMNAPCGASANSKPNCPFWVLQDANFNTLGVVRINRDSHLLFLLWSSDRQRSDAAA